MEVAKTKGTSKQRRFHVDNQESLPRLCRREHGGQRRVKGPLCDTSQYIKKLIRRMHVAAGRKVNAEGLSDSESEPENQRIVKPPLTWPDVANKEKFATPKKRRSHLKIGRQRTTHPNIEYDERLSVAHRVVAEIVSGSTCTASCRISALCDVIYGRRLNNLQTPDGSWLRNTDRLART